MDARYPLIRIQYIIQGIGHSLRAVALLLFLLLGIASAQNSMVTQKITVFKDGAQIAQKGILRFHESKAQVITGYNFLPESIEVNKSGDYGIRYVKFKLDSIETDQVVKSWKDVLKANMNREVTVVFEIGNEYDEISGDVKMVSDDSEIFSIKTNGDRFCFIDLSTVKQILIENGGRSKVKQVKITPIMEVMIDQNMPFTPLEFTGLIKGFSWESSCKIFTVNDHDAKYEFGGVVSNNAADFDETLVELKGAHLFNDVPHSEQNHEIFPIGKIALDKGESIVVKLSDTKHEYERVFLCDIPWRGPGKPERTGPFPVIDAVKFKQAVEPATSCEQISLLDEDYNLLGQVPSAEILGGKLEFIPLGSDVGLKIYYAEEEPKKGGKKIKIGEQEYEKLSMSGKIIIINAKAEAAEVTVTRSLFGEIGKVEGATEVPSEKPLETSLSWTITLRAGASKELHYEYDAYIPVN